MNRLILVRHGGSTGNEDPGFYAYGDSALCLTTNGIRQALTTGTMLAGIEPRWAKPGNFALEVFASEYTRARQTARIALDQMGLPSACPAIRPLLNERDYGTTYDPRMDTDPAFDGDNSESSIAARHRVKGLMTEFDTLLFRADVLAFSHFGTMRALVANLLELDDRAMMALDVPNGGAFIFDRRLDDEGRSLFTQRRPPTTCSPRPPARSPSPRPPRPPSSPGWRSSGGSSE